MKDSPLHALVVRKTGTALSNLQRERLDQAAAPHRQGRDERAFVDWLESPFGKAALDEILTAIPVHKTDLFRDPDQLAVLEHAVLPKLLRTRRGLTVWSAGCATGEEVATLLILLAEAGVLETSTVLGTDLSGRALGVARTLTFSAQAMRRVPASLTTRFFDAQGESFALKEHLKARARFERHNLMDRPYPRVPGRPGFDLVVCRNVLIYFTEGAFERVVGDLAASLTPGGALMLSAAEPILTRRRDLHPMRLDGASLYEQGPDPTQADPVTSPPAPSAPPPRPTAPPPALAPPEPAPSRPPLEGVKRTTTFDDFKALRPSEAKAPDDPVGDGVELFHRTLDGAAMGQSDAATEAGLRQALYLAPDLVPARYLLGVLLEEKGMNADAASEFRRAHLALKNRKARMTSFFLNASRLELACEQALKRLGY